VAAYRCFTAHGRERIPLFGNFGLVSQLGSIEYARSRKCHHTTVLHAIQKVQRLRSEDESLDAIVEVLIAALREDVGSPPVQSVVAAPWQEEFVEAITARVLNRLAELGLEPARIVRRSTSVQSETNFDRAALLKRDAAAGVMRAARRSSRCRQYSCATGS
jgi:hypothetical protein